MSSLNPATRVAPELVMTLAMHVIATQPQAESAPRRNQPAADDGRRSTREGSGG